MKQRWSAGDTTYGAWLSVPSPFAAEIVGRADFDYVCLDLQHGVLDYQVAVGMLQALRTSDATPLVRVPSNDFAAINRALDAGALGVVVPMIQSPADAAEAVRACRYPPEGERSFGPTRASFSEGADYFSRANAAVACIPMIETRGALETLDEILELPGVDGIYVGPNDLSLALGSPPGMDNEGPYQDAYRRIAKACEAHGKTAGIHGTPRLAEKHRATGYRMITVSGDVGALAGGVARDLRTARGE